VDKTGNV